MTSLVFPGQGSQKLGMGADLFDKFPIYVEQANDILGYDLKKLCLEDANQALNLTQFTQPALFTVGALAYLQYREENAQAKYVAGHSLGEYNALYAAEVFDFETGLRLVAERGRLMSLAKEGGMAAIVGLSQDEITAVLQQNELCAGISIANYNTYTQHVITGPKQDIEMAISIFEQAGARMVVPLNVSGAFHSRLMEPAKSEFLPFLQNFTYQAPKCKIIANLSAKPYDVSERSISETLALQMTHSVLWTDTIEYLLAEGEDNFVELGNGAVLSGLIRRIKNKQ